LCLKIRKYAGNRFSSQKYKDVDLFIKNFTNSPKKFSSLKAKKAIDAIVAKHGDCDGWGL
ncbi:MAG: hypothetical protein C5B45_03650, partial [Chlamydiae bacterium]